MNSFLVGLRRRGQRIAWGLLALAAVAGSVSGAPWPQPAAAEPFVHPGEALPAVTVTRYAVGARIDRARRITGVATLHASAISEVRQVALFLGPGLELSGARLRLADGDAWEPVKLDVGASAGEDVRLPLPRRLPAGARFTLELDFQALPEWLDLDDGIFATVPGRSWYPRLGEEPATFELEAPAGIEVSVAGEPGIATPGLVLVPAKAFKRAFQFADLRVRLRCARRSSEIVSPGSSGGIGPMTGSTSSAARLLAFRSPLQYLTQVALARFQGSFGPLPWEQVELVQVGAFRPGLSWPGLVVVPIDGGPAPEGALHRHLSEETYFELARQWWGHAVRPGRDEDRWLLDGLAEHAVALAIEQHWGRVTAGQFRERARDRVLAEIPPGATLAARPPDAAAGSREGGGPAWRALKGALVLESLRRLLSRSAGPDPDAAWFGALRELASTYAGKSPTTDDFQRIVERHLPPAEVAGNAGQLDWFFDQWVRGAEVPVLTSALSAQKVAQGRYRITGSVALAEVSETFRALVPLHAELGKSGAARFGHIQLIGTTSGVVDVTVALPRKPKSISANLRYEVLTRDP